MADETTNELEDFLFTLNNVFDMSRRSQCNRDPIGIEHCKNKMEHYILTVVAMKVAVDENTTANGGNGPNSLEIRNLLDNLVTAMEREIGKLSNVLESFPVEEPRNVISLLPSTGGRPAYNIAKDQIEQLNQDLSGVLLWNFWVSLSERFKDQISKLCKVMTSK